MIAQIVLEIIREYDSRAARPSGHSLATFVDRARNGYRSTPGRCEDKAEAGAVVGADATTPQSSDSCAKINIAADTSLTAASDR